MKVQILIDNRTETCDKKSSGNCSRLTPEWGLAALVEFNGHKILLDTGASSSFATNAEAMKVDLPSVDAGVLSHAHFDHANGLRAFFEKNDHAKFYLREGAGENCYHEYTLLKILHLHFYIGIRRGWLKRYADRIKFVNGTAEILPGVFLVGHNNNVFSAEDRAEIGSRNGLSIKQKGKYLPDSFDHEQSLVLDTPQGLFIMNSCSHGGADNIVREIEVAFPGKKIYAILGGFHLYRTPEQKIREFAERLRALDVQKIYTGHCTGEHGFKILHDILGDRAQQMHTGMTIEF